MLYWVLVFLVVSLMTGILAVVGVAASPAGASTALMSVLLSFVALSLLAGVVRRAR